MAKAHDDRKKKQRPKPDDRIEIRELNDGILPFPCPPSPSSPILPKKSDLPPTMGGGERALQELQDMLEELGISTEEELDALIDGFNGRKTKSTRKKMPSNPKREAQDLAYQAMETPDPIKSAELCTKAIQLHPHCVDALMHLTRLSCEDGDEIIEHMKMVVDIGHRDLGGTKYFKENVGYFWGLLETRPYMRARAYLAQVLVEAGKHDEAVDHYEEMLRLNPNDNQGLRYPLIGLYLLVGNLDGVRRMFKEYEDGDSAVFAWSAVLERYLSGDTAGAAKALKDARRCNKHAEKYLTGKKSLPKALPDFYGQGDENEAVVCADSIGPAWKQHPEVVSWIKKAKAT